MTSVILSYLLEVSSLVSDVVTQSHTVAATYLPFLHNQYVFAASVASLVALPLLYFLFFVETVSL